MFILLNSCLFFCQKKKVRSRQKKLKAYDLSTLTEFLPNLKASQQPKPAEFKLKSKTRKNLVWGLELCLSFKIHHPFLWKSNLFLRMSTSNRLKEGNQLQAVLTHPAFQSDPLGAIHQHLQSTQPTVDEKPKLREKKNGNRKEKKISKASTGLQSMET